MSKNALLIYSALIFLGLGSLLIFQSQNLTEPRLIFCDVGQGDGMLIMAPFGKQVVVDGGPGKKMADCLGRYMPFWDRKVEMVVLTHPQKDHMEGLIDVLGRYKVLTIVHTGIGNQTGEYKAWSEALKVEEARVHVAGVGDRFVLGQELSLSVLWPNKEKTYDWLQNPPKDLNETSIVMRLDIARSTGSGCAYLTGDIPKEILQGLVDRACQVLKIAHHGSKTGTNMEVLEKAKPQVAVIQVGKNSYGHPHKEITDLLESKGIKILRNDINGTVVIEADGQQYKVTSGR